MAQQKAPRSLAYNKGKLKPAEEGAPKPRVPLTELTDSFTINGADAAHSSS
jgi:hypothetical protein